MLRWWHRRIWHDVPDAMAAVEFAPAPSSAPIWLAQGNPLENLPWSQRPEATLPQRARIVVIGAGATGAALAYHWCRRSPADAGRSMLVLDMADPASGGSGRGDGMVSMGLPVYRVFRSVLTNLERVRPDVPDSQRRHLARQFAIVYGQAGYRNADMIEQTIRHEGYDCDYARQGALLAYDVDQQAELAEAVRMAQETGLTDFTSITPEEAAQRGGIVTDQPAGFSIATACLHPGKWVWSLLKTAIQSRKVELYTRTKVMEVEPAGAEYLIHTTRGTIKAQGVVSATGAFTPMLHPAFHDRLVPMRGYAVAGTGGPAGLPPHIGVFGRRGFCRRHGEHIILGCGPTRNVADHEVECSVAARGIIAFLLTDMTRWFGASSGSMTHIWSSISARTADEYPIVGALDGRAHYLITGAAGDDIAISFNAARCVVNRILSITSEPDDYPEACFAPSRVLDPRHYEAFTTETPKREQEGA